MPMHGEQVKAWADQAVRETPITDIHTHLYPPAFGSLLLWGMDELLTYHYLVAETFRYTPLPYAEFWRMSKKEQADLIWKTLFVEHSPISEACRGVLTVLKGLGLDTASRDLDAYRRYFSRLTAEQYLDIVLANAGVQTVVMTNDPFDDAERNCWDQEAPVDARMKAALRIDGLLNQWPDAVPKLKAWGYRVELVLTEDTLAEVSRFLTDWAARMDALYMAVSLPPSFQFPEPSVRSKLIHSCVLPVCRQLGIPFAMMIGVKKLVNPDLKLAGDSVGKSTIEAVEYLCAQYPRNKFMVTMLARENQHELCVAARKFRNLLIFGCWWFLNNPSLMEEITRMRLELLGLSMIPQHSDARVLDQLIYKWSHSRAVLASCLKDKYADLIQTGWVLTEDEIRRDVEQLFGGAFWSFIA